MLQVTEHRMGQPDRLTWPSYGRRQVGIRLNLGLILTGSKGQEKKNYTEIKCSNRELLSASQNPCYISFVK